MADFKCTYINNEGKTKKEVIASDNLDILRQDLKLEGKILLEAREVTGIKAKKKSPSNKLLPSAELANFCRQLGIIVSTGASMITSLETLIDQANSKLMKAELTRLYQGMQMGKTMAEIMSDNGTHFPELLAGMVATGESSGTLDIVFKSMADYYTRDSMIKKKIKSAMIYPTILFCMAILMVFGFLRFILPNLIEIITSSGVKLPAMTLFVMALSDIVTKYYWLIAIIAAGVIYAIKSYIRTEKGRLVKDKLIMKIPVLKRSIRNIVTARVSQGLGLFVTSGFPLPKGLELLMRTTNNAIAEIALRQALNGIQQGESLTANLAKGEFFDKLFLQMLAIGEQTGSMQHITKEMTEHYERETELSIQKATSLIEPVIMLVIGAIIGFMIIAVALPMFTIYNSIE